MPTTIMLDMDPTARRHGGNAASAAAYDEGKPRHEGERERIYAMIAASPAGLTSKEIGAQLGKALHTFSGRITQLKQAHRVVGTGAMREKAEVLIVSRPPVQLDMWEVARG